MVNVGDQSLSYEEQQMVTIPEAVREKPRWLTLAEYGSLHEAKNFVYAIGGWSTESSSTQYGVTYRCNAVKRLHGIRCNAVLKIRPMGEKFVVVKKLVRHNHEELRNYLVKKVKLTN